MIPEERHQFLTQFYSQTVQVAHELRIPIYHNVSANVLDYMKIALMISNVNWDIKEILSQHNTYVDILVNELQLFRNQFLRINETVLPVPKAVYRTVWDQILDKIFYTMVEGYDDDDNKNKRQRIICHFRLAMQMRNDAVMKVEL